MPIDLSKLSDSELEAIIAGGQKDGVSTQPKSIEEVSTSVLDSIIKQAEQEELAARRVQVPTSAFSMVRPEFMGAQFQPDDQTIAKGGQAALRYGIPIATGVATGGVGFIPAVVGGASSAIGETLAQLAEMQSGEREQMSGTEILASGVGGAAPVFQFKVTPKNADVLLSPAAKSFFATLTGQIGASEASRYIRDGEFRGLSGKDFTEKAKEGAIRWGLPIGVSWLSSKGGQLEKAAEDIAQVEREGRGAILMDVRPELATLESKAFQAGHEKAIKYASQMDAGLPDIVRAAYGDMSPQSQSEIAQILAPFKGVYDDANAALAKATEVANRAKDELKAAEATRSANLSKIKVAAEIAEEQRLLAANNKDTIVKRIFGKGRPIMTEDVSIGALQQRMMDTAAAAEAGVESGLDALYTASGIRPNDVVVSKQDVLRSINARKAEGRALEGNIARADAERAVELFFGENDTATLEQLRKFKDVIARNLPNGSPPDAAARYAGSLYDSLKKSSYRFIESNYSEDTLNAFRQAQNRAAANFASREGSAIEMLKSGDFSGFYRAAKEDGRLGVMMAELDAYANSLSRLTKGAIESGQVGRASDMAAINMARQFKEDVNKVLLNGIVNESIVGRAAGRSLVTDVVDPKKLIETLGYFESQGFTMRQLGIDGKEMSKLIKANAMVGKEPLTVGKLNDFLELLPSTGGDVAAARIAYRQAVANAMIEGGAKEQAAAFQKAKRIADQANLDEAARNAEMNVALGDPTVRFFKENGSMLIGNGALQNSDWVDNIIKKDPDTIKKFVAAIQDPASEASKLGVMPKLREAAIAYAVKQFLPDVAQTGNKLNAERIVAPFVSNNRDMVMLRENMKTILGKEGYDKMVGLVIEPLRKVLVNRVSLCQDI